MSKDIQNNDEKSNSYFKYLVFVLMIVQILDAYTTVLPGSIPSLIANEFLSSFSTEVQNSIMATAGAFVSIGMYFLFFTQYLSDKLGRKTMLVITACGMAVATLGMMLSINYVMYMSFVFLLYFFFSSDIWLIMINEEAKPTKRALFSNLLLIVGLIGPICMVIFRFIFVSGTAPNWRGMMLFPVILGFALTLVILLSLKESSKFQLMKENPSMRKKRSLKEDLKLVFGIENRKALIAVLIMSFFFMGSNMYIGLFEKYISDVGTLSQAQVTIIMLLTIFMVLIAYLTNGFLADRVGRKPLLYLWVILSPISVLIWVIGATIPEYAFILVLLGYSFSHVTFWGTLFVLRIVVLEILPTDRRGTGLGIRSLCGSVGSTMALFLSSAFILIVGLGITFVIFILTNLILIPLCYFYIKETKGVDLRSLK